MLLWSDFRSLVNLLTTPHFHLDRLLVGAECGAQMANIEFDPAALMDELEDKCWQCLAYPQTPPCDICDGKGWLLTWAGKRLVEFMKRWSA